MSDDIGREFAKAWVRGVADAAKLEERLAKLEPIVRDLAGCNPVEVHTDRTFWCRLCGAGPIPLPVSEPDHHDSSCPWRRARELMGELQQDEPEEFRED